MIYAESNSFLKIWEVEHSEKYSTVKMGSSRKNKNTNEWINSNWSFIRFVGNAHEKSKYLKKGSKITNMRFSIDNEPYKNKNGEISYPTKPKIVVYDFEIVEEQQNNTHEEVDEMDCGDLPF